VAEGPRVEGEVLGGLDEEPAGVGGALFGDGAVVAVFAGLVGGRDEAEVRGGTVGGGEALGVAEDGEEGFGDIDVDAGQGHEEFDLGRAVGVAGEVEVELVDLGLEGGELAEVAVEGEVEVVGQGELVEPGEVSSGKEVAGGGLEEGVVEDGVDAVFDASAVGGEVGAGGGEVAEGGGVGVGDPDFGQEVGAEELGEDEGVDFVGFDAGLGDGAGAQGVGDDEAREEGLEEGDDGPGVEGGLEGELVGGLEVSLGEVEEGLAGGGEADFENEFAVGVNGGTLDLFFVDIEAEKAWHTDCTSRVRRAGPGRAGAGGCGPDGPGPAVEAGNEDGQTAPTYASSKLNRVDRRGGQI